jgi:choloylglycine hydrolase
VAEVLAGLDAVRPAGRVPIHYLMADATGDAATVEFLGGTPVVHRGPTLPVRALTNSTYTDSLAAFAAAQRAGSAPRSDSSLDRFARAGMLAAAGGRDPVARGFEILDAVRSAGPTATRWSIVYDLSAREVHFRTDADRTVRRFGLARLDFSCATPVRMLDVIAAGAGDVEPAFTDYTRAANRALIEAAFGVTPFLKDIPAAGKDALAAHPERAACGR